MKRLLTLILALTVLADLAWAQPHKIHVYAHRGCWSKAESGEFIIPMLHSAIWESYEVAQSMFGDEWICFTTGVKNMQRVRKFSDCTILLAINDGSAQENISRLEKIGGRCGISSMNYGLYTAGFCKALTEAGYQVQASIFPFEQEKLAISNGITYLLTDRILPSGKWRKIKTRH